MRLTHLIAALLALLLIAGLLASGVLYAETLENRYVHALASEQFDQKDLGSAMQRAAFRQPDLLPVYGSSELALQKPYQDPYRAITLFRGEPTGFNIFPIGGGDTTDLVLLQRLAGVGPELRGKKVVISLSPTWFFERRQEPSRAYAGNFSRLQASELVFSTDLSDKLKHEIVKRMLDYPSTLAHNPLLRFAVEKLADRSPISRALYYLALPLGKLQNLVLRLQDHWEILTYIRSHPHIQPNQPLHGAPPNWSSLSAKAERETQQITGNNPFGFDGQDWQRDLHWQVAARRGTMSDKAFMRGLRRAREWTDFELLLRTLHELGAKPLVLSMPIGGRYYDYLGVSPQARALYYSKVRGLASRYGAAERDFAEHDEDPYFVLNARGHLLPTGWIYYSQALDNFYHDRPLL
jgi:D-alanine transfer protein